VRNPTPPRPGSGHFGFYFASSGEHDLFSVASIISQVLFELGKSESEDVSTFSEEEVQKYFGVCSLNSTSIVKNDAKRWLVFREVQVLDRTPVVGLSAPGSC
jgi:hypothetical protein